MTAEYGKNCVSDNQKKRSIKRHKEKESCAGRTDGSGKCSAD